MIINQIGLGGGKCFAALIITYPEGATCIATCGGKTLDPIGTETTTFFAIPCAGEWTVFCTNSDGTKTVSKSAEITYEGQVATLDIAYTLWLFNGGAIVPWTANKMGRITDLAEFSINSNYYNTSNIEVSTTLNMTITYPTQGNFATSDPIDMTPYSTLTLTANAWKNSGNTLSVQYCVAVTNSTAQNTWYSSAAAKSGVITASGQRTITLDISSLTGSFYVAMWAGNDNAGYQFDKVRLE